MTRKNIMNDGAAGHENSTQENKPFPVADFLPLTATGRPTKYDEAKATAIYELLKRGVTRKAAAGSVGVSYATLLRWIKAYASFARLVEQSEDIAEATMTLYITEAAKTDPKYALEWLKRRRRDEWSDNLAMDVRRMSDEELYALAAGIQAEETGIPA